MTHKKEEWRIKILPELNLVVYFTNKVFFPRENSLFVSAV